MPSTATTFDTDCVLMAHLDTDLIDSSFVNPKTIEAAGGAAISAAQSKFGGGSCLFDGEDSDLSVPSHADFNIGTQNFTIDFQVRFATNGTESLMFRFGASTTNLYLSANALAGRFDLNVAGAARSYATGAGTGVWYHVAVVRSSGVVKFFFDGTQVSTDLSAADSVSQGEWRTGSYPATAIDLDGFLDEYRIVVGTAVWTENFTAPIAAYTQAGAAAAAGSTPRKKTKMLLGLGV